MRTNTNSEQLDAFKQAVWTLAEWLVSEYQRGRLQRASINDTPPPGPKDTSRRLMDVESLAKYLSVPKSTLYTDVCLRKIPAKC